MTDVTTVQERFKYSREKTNILRELIATAFFHDVSEVREVMKRKISDNFRDFSYVFCGDNQFFVMRDKQAFYVGDVPNCYKGNEMRERHFFLRNYSLRH